MQYVGRHRTAMDRLEKKSEIDRIIKTPGFPTTRLCRFWCFVFFVVVCCCLQAQRQKDEDDVKREEQLKQQEVNMLRFEQRKQASGTSCTSNVQKLRG